jgi:hypothetical protein
MAETEPHTPLISENECKCEKQLPNKEEEIVPPDGGFWVSFVIFELVCHFLCHLRHGLSWQAVSWSMASFLAL